jgi:hypothetical protein
MSGGLTETEIVAAEGAAATSEPWRLMYRPADGLHCLKLIVNGASRDEVCGFDIPRVTEIGFSGGLTPGHGQYFLYGLVSSRIRVVRAEGSEEVNWSAANTVALAGATGSDGTALRTFVLIRPPVDDVSALVGLDRGGRIVQRIPFPGRSSQS